ncbi:hypothetical protein BGX23_001102 [Mortierella sp. AD031]|nr:hypothetical protein BGX23_001102 [Mortierella sp. AD031]
MFHPTRGGTRGGQDQFKWEDVKEDKHRENYLGNSLLAPVGRWQKGRDLTWYAKDNSSNTDADSALSKKQAEIQNIKDAEAEAMAEALGYKTKRKKDTNVSEKELSSVINKNKIGAQDEMDDNIKESSAAQGLGFNKRQGVLSGANSVAIPKGGPNRAGTVPLVPLIPTANSDPVAKDKERERTKEGRSSHRHRGSTRDDQDRHNKRRRSSRSASPSRKHRRDRGRDHSRDRSRSRTKDHERDSKSSKRQRERSKSKSRSREREADRHEAQSRHRHDDRRSKHRSRSRSGSRERHASRSKNKDHSDSRHKIRRDERDSDRGRSERRRSVEGDRSRSRSRSRGHGSSSLAARNARAI